MNSTGRDRPLLAVLLVTLAMADLGLVDNFMRAVAQEAGLWQFHLMRAILVCSVLALLARFRGWRIKPRNWRAVALRSFFFSSSMILYLGAAGFLPIAQVGAGLFTAPIFVLVISALFFGTRIGLWRVLAVGIGFVGVVLILGPEAGGISAVSTIPVMAGLLYALNNIATRRWCAGETTLTLLFGVFAALGLWGALGLGVLALWQVPPDIAAQIPFFARGWVAPSQTFITLLLVHGTGALVAVALLTRGYQLGEVSFISVVEYVYLGFAAFWSWALYGALPDRLGVVGIVAIVISGTIIALRSREVAPVDRVSTQVPQ